MSAVVGMGRAGRGFRGAPRPHFVEAGHRRRGGVAPSPVRAVFLAVAAVAGLGLIGLVFARLALVVFAFAVVTRFRVPSFRMLMSGWLQLFAHPGDGLPDQLLNRRNALAVSRRNDGDCGPATPGAPGAADAMDIVVGMV